MSYVYNNHEHSYKLNHLIQKPEFNQPLNSYLVSLKYRQYFIQN